MDPKGDVKRQPLLYECISPGLITGFLPITPSPSTISVLLSASLILQNLEVSCTESLLWFSIVIRYLKANCIL